ncbi:MAG TPA: MarR family transcriptional regulator [Solirubrobacteraceae bacterium]|nr:MarR family transcriptional regulator [Solirubrobacteraceae bacterium]
MSATTSTDTCRCGYELQDDGLASWEPVHAEAWIGLLETHKRLTRALDAELEAQHGLSFSALEVLGRLARGENRSFGLSALAGACGLSLSRISRIIDSLERRGLVTRRTVEADARAVQAQLTDAGLELVRQAQRTHFASVQNRFFEQLSDQEVATLARIFTKFAPAEVQACTGSPGEDQLADR